MTYSKLIAELSRLFNEAKDSKYIDPLQTYGAFAAAEAIAKSHMLFSVTKSRAAGIGEKEG
jgi:hypothetical protein